MTNKQTNDFFIKEYESIVKAHFNSSERVTSFFRYILIIYSAALAILINVSSSFKPVIPYILITISIIGFFVHLYLIQLRNESILYARTINGMRRYFFDMYFEKDYFVSRQYSVLPIINQKPSFNDNAQFIWIRWTISVINSVYFAAGIITLGPKSKLFIKEHLMYNFDIEKMITYIILYWYWIILIIFFINIHYFVPKFITRKNESDNYNYKHIIGVDIDGVLNEHVDQFCKFITKSINVSIKKDDITKIPVHLCRTDISKENEEKIFKQKEYWTTLPVKDKTNFINDIKSKLGYKIYIFTWRPWGREKRKCLKFLNCVWKEFDLKQITKDWLKEKGIKYDKLYFEEGNLQHPITIRQSLYKNRYFLSKKFKIKYFIEDDLNKAISLSNICKVVFLISQKYNEPNEIPYNKLPHNIIRVDNMEDVFEYLKKLG